MRARGKWNPFYEVNASSSIINPDVLEAVRQDDTLTHPWLNRTDISHGKRLQIWYLLSALDAGAYYFPFYSSVEFPDRIMPLLSQPLIELCLQIPLHTHSAGGWQRAVERLAFAAEVPPSILLRREKGFISDFLIRLVEHNAVSIREFLLGGHLARERVVDTHKLASLLSPGSSTDFSDRTALAAKSSVLALFIGIEAWLRRWSSATYADSGAEAPALTGQLSH
jgi:asparagine synthase (glutamine-hydrolysing)